MSNKEKKYEYFDENGKSCKGPHMKSVRYWLTYNHNEMYSKSITLCDTLATKDNPCWFTINENSNNDIFLLICNLSLDTIYEYKDSSTFGIMVALTKYNIPDQLQTRILELL